MSEKLAKAGYTQGDMSPKVEDYQKPASNYSQEGFSKTLDYVSRQENYVGKECSKIKSQGYQGRYS